MNRKFRLAPRTNAVRQVTFLEGIAQRNSPEAPRLVILEAVQVFCVESANEATRRLREDRARGQLPLL